MVIRWNKNPAQFLVTNEMVLGGGGRSKITIDASETKSYFQAGLYSKIKRERDPKS